MPRTSLHKKLGMLAGGAAKTGQSNAELLAKINRFEQAIDDARVIPRLETALARFDVLLTKTEQLIDLQIRRQTGGSTGGTGPGGPTGGPGTRGPTGGGTGGKGSRGHGAAGLRSSGGKTSD